MNKNILVITNGQEQGPDLVISKLRQNKACVFRLNIEKYPTQHNHSINFNNILNGYISTADGVLNINDIDAVWYWKPKPCELPDDISNEVKDLIYNEVCTFLWSVYTCIDVKWINNPYVASKLLEDNKLYQLIKAKRIGFTVPHTYLGNSPEDIISFVDSCDGDVVVKPFYTSCFQKENGEVGAMFTRKITPADLVDRDSLSICPVFLQEYIPKLFELRITVIGSRIFACKIDSQNTEESKIDWRKGNISNMPHSEYVLSDSLKDKILKLMSELDIVYGAIDMIVTPKEEYIFLEINPGGRWEWIEQETNFDISGAISSELLK